MKTPEGIKLEQSIIEHHHIRVLIWKLGIQLNFQNGTWIVINHI